ncbi:glycosyltransferase [Clostridioides difficile]
MEPLVSIIIPVYNCEIYIGKCIDSVINQSYENIEIIIINDGSLDKSEDIINRYVELDNRINYIEQENLGPSVARNNGIEKSTGDYIMFVDSDDNINKFYVEKLLKKILNKNYDIACCGYIDESKYGIINLNDFWNGNDSLDKEEFISCVCNGVGGVLWGKVFKRETIIRNNIRMNPDLFMSEDLIFILEYCQYSNSFGVINENLYYYNRMNDNSISSNIDINYLENYVVLITKITELLSKLELSKETVKNMQGFKVQSLVYRVITSESNKYFKNKDKNNFIGNMKLILESPLIDNYKSDFISESKFEKIMNKLIINKQYMTLLRLNLLIIKLRRVKDKILRR